MTKSFFVVRWSPPADVAKSDKATRLRYWSLATEVILERKDQELEAGIAADGKPLGRPSDRWLKRRRSRMTPVGVPGDPSAPLFQPGREVSRVRSLLTGRGYDGYTKCWWRYDSFSGREWGEILAHWADVKGPRWDVIGLSPKGRKWCERETNRRWAATSKDTSPANAPDGRVGGPLEIPKTRDQSTRYIDMMTDTTAREVERAIAEGRFSGWRTSAELEKLMRSKPKTPGVIRDPSRTAPAVKKGATNILLEHTWKSSPKPQPPAGLWSRIRTAWRSFVTRLGI
jgi:hypothetical protein